MKTRDLIIVGAAVMILSFPLMWIIMLLATGNARFVFEGDLARMIEVQTIARQQRSGEARDALIAESAESFHANLRSIDSLARERERFEREQERLNFLIDELTAERMRIENERQIIQNERTRFESAISGQLAEQNSARNQRVNDLARIYQAMRPAEAAQIMQTLPEDLFVDIMLAMTDDRQRSRILSAMDIDNSTRMTELMSVRLNRAGR